MSQSAQNHPQTLSAAGNTVEELQETLSLGATDIILLEEGLRHEHQQHLRLVDDMNATRQVQRYTRASTMASLYKDLTLNDLGLPDYIYRCDIIPGDFFSYTAEERTAILQAASVSVEYTAGYPTLETGEPLWSIFDFEPIGAHTLFTQYCMIPENNPGTPVRSLTSFAEAVRMDLKVLVEYANLYCWGLRAKAYDLFIAAMYRKAREQRAYSVEAKQFDMAAKKLEQASQIIDDMLKDPDNKGDIKFRDVVALFKEAASMQRTVVGMENRKHDDDIPRNATTEVILRTIAKNSGEQAKFVNNDDKIRGILENPDDLAMAQELIIKMNR